jgi:hypothetical protein
MIKSIATAAVLSLGLAGYAFAQEAAPAAAPTAPAHHHKMAPKPAEAPKS